ncbi:MAG: tetratricopeptide repeat protein [Polyangiales bacterium]
MMTRTRRLAAGLGAVLSLTAAPAFADEAEVHYRMCLVHKQASRWEQAAQECREAVRLRPTHSAAHFTLGSVLRQAGRMEDALTAFREAARLEPRGTGARRAWWARF